MAKELVTNKGAVRTDMNCTNCYKNFIAKLDFSLDGNHIVECPWCAHEHCRVIEKGTVTGDRWSSRNNMPRIEVEKRSVWKHDSQPMESSTASHFIRDRWLNRSDF